LVDLCSLECIRKLSSIDESVELWCPFMSYLFCGVYMIIFKWIKMYKVFTLQKSLIPTFPGNLQSKNGILIIEKAIRLLWAIWNEHHIMLFNVVFKTHFLLKTSTD
jgi:hypothetical protein